MRNGVIGLIIGVVLGIVLGATIIAPRLQRTAASTGAPPSPAAADLAKQLPRALVARPAVSLKLATAYPLEMPIAGALARRIDTRIWDVSRGQIEIRPYPPGALAPAEALFEALGSGAIDAALFSPQSAGDLVPALRIFAGLPFGPSTDEFLAWMQFGTGDQLLEEVAGSRGVHALICGVLPPASFGWFRRDVVGLQDLRGLQMNATGLSARVLARIGASVVDLPPGALMLGLEQGSVDAVSWSSPAIDRHMGFATWLKFYYPQGWGKSPTVLYLMLGRKTWEGLNASQQAQIETVCGDNVRYSSAEGEATQFAALKAIYGEGVHVQRLSPSIEDALKQAWQPVLQDAIDSDPDFQRVWQSLSAFRADWSVWRELSRQ